MQPKYGLFSFLWSCGVRFPNLHEAEVICGRRTSHLLQWHPFSWISRKCSGKGWVPSDRSVTFQQLINHLQCTVTHWAFFPIPFHVFHWTFLHRYRNIRIKSSRFAPPLKCAEKPESGALSVTVSYWVGLLLTGESPAVLKLIFLLQRRTEFLRTEFLRASPHPAACLLVMCVSELSPKSN